MITSTKPAKKIVILHIIIIIDKNLYINRRGVRKGGKIKEQQKKKKRVDNPLFQGLFHLLSMIEETKEENRLGKLKIWSPSPPQGKARNTPPP